MKCKVFGGQAQWCWCLKDDDGGTVVAQAPVVANKLDVIRQAFPNLLSPSAITTAKPIRLANLRKIGLFIRSAAS